MQTSEFQADAKIRAVLGYFMGLIQRTVGIVRRASFSLTRGTIVLLKRLSFWTVLMSQTGYPNNLRYSPCLFLQIHTPTF